MTLQTARLLLFAILLAELFGAAIRARATPAATTTTLALSSSNFAITSVKSGSVVTLTATVTAGGAPVTTGQVEFCDAISVYCTDIHLLGAAQLTSAGSAVFKFIPGIGNHAYKAVFLGTTNNATSASSNATLTVTPAALLPTETAIAQSGSSGSYVLTATVVGTGGVASPTGTVSFLDTNNGNAVLAATALGTGMAGLNFLNSSSPAMGSNPQSIAVSDFNGDGIPDLAVLNNAQSTVTILLGNGNGTFTQAAYSPMPVGEFPWSIAVGDFNSDGIPDLAVANYGDSTVTILLGNGDGTFTPVASPILVGGSPDSVVMGDFNGDGIPDLAVLVPGGAQYTNSGVYSFIGSTVTIFLGNGDGTFTQAAQCPVTPGGYEYSLAVGDFNGDGIADLALTMVATWSLTDANVMIILLGNGDGTFTELPNLPPVGNDPVSVAVGDFNQSGIQDLAVANYEDSTVTILMGNGNGTFTQAANSPISVGSAPLSIAGGDFNGDGILDLAIANEGGNSVTILLGNGNGTFTQATSSPVSVGAAPMAVAVGDLNGDGFTDFAVGTLGSNTVSVLLSEPTETVSVATNVTLPVGSGAHLVAANYSGDSNYSSSTSGTTQLPAQLTTPTVMVTPSSSSIATTQGLAVTVSVNGGNGNPTPSGTLTLTSGSFASSATTLSGGGTTINIPAGSLAVGYGTLTASYTPDSFSSSNYTSAIGSAPVTVTVGTKITPALTVTPSLPSIESTQSLEVTVEVNGGAGNPAPTGLVTLTSGTPTIYDTFQYPDGTLINGNTAQSGNSVWTVEGDGIGVIQGNYLIDSAPLGQAGNMYASLANTSSVGATPSPIITIGGTIRLCPSAVNSYAPYYTSVGLIASHDLSFSSLLEIAFGPGYWWVDKVLNGVQTYLLSGTENLSVDCMTDYTVEIIINQAAGTLQVIPPSGIPSPVITSPDITSIDALYGTWEPENDATYKYVGEWGSVWMGGNYISSAVTLNGGTATIVVPPGSLSAGSETLTANYVPDSFSFPSYNSGTGSASVSVTNSVITAPTVTLTPSASSIPATQGLTVTIAVGGGAGTPAPTGTVTLMGASYISAATPLVAGVAKIVIPAGMLRAGGYLLSASYAPDSVSSGTYGGATGSSLVTVTTAAPGVTVTPSASVIATTEGLTVTVTVAVSGGTGTPLPTGAVTLTAGSYSSNATVLSGGSSTIVIPGNTLAVGSVTLSASYAPDSTSSGIYVGATGTSALTVTTATPGVTVTPSASTIATAQGMTVTVGVSGGTGNPVATGAVTLNGSSYSSAATPLSGGTATIGIASGSLLTGTFQNVHRIVGGVDAGTSGASYPQDSSFLELIHPLRAAWGDGGPGFYGFSNAVATVAPVVWYHSANWQDVSAQAAGSTPWKYTLGGKGQYDLAYTGPTGTFTAYNVAEGGPDPNKVVITQGVSDAGAIDTPYTFNFVSDNTQSGMSFHLLNGDYFVWQPLEYWTNAVCIYEWLNTTGRVVILGCDFQIAGVSGTQGISLTNLGLGPQTMAEWDQLDHPTQQKLYALLKPDLVIMNGCTNDRMVATASVCAGYLQDWIVDVETGWPAAQILLERPPNTGDAATTYLSQYGPALQALAASDTGLGYHVMYRDDSALLGSEVSAAAAGYMSPNSTGSGAVFTCNWSSTAQTCTSYTQVSAGSGYVGPTYLTFKQDGSCSLYPTGLVATSGGGVSGITPLTAGNCATAPTPVLAGGGLVTVTNGVVSGSDNANLSVVGDQLLAADIALKNLGVPGNLPDPGPTPMAGRGMASLSVAAGSVPVGSATLTASYMPDASGSATYGPAMGTSAAPVTVTTATWAIPTVTVIPSSPAVTTAQSLTVTVGVSGGTGTPTGAVTLTAGGYTSPATTLGGGSAVFTLPAGTLSPGSTALTVIYTPDTTSSAIDGVAMGSSLVTVTTN